MACVSTEGLIGTILGGLEVDIAVIRLYAWVVCQHPVGSLIELHDRSRCKVQAVPDEGGHPSEVIRGQQGSSAYLSRISRLVSFLRLVLCTAVVSLQTSRPRA